MSLVTKKLECRRCHTTAETIWHESDADHLLRPIDLLPLFFERVRLNNNRTGTEIVCNGCERAVPWPSRTPQAPMTAQI
jgi:hypothetical protein